MKNKVITFLLIVFAGMTMGLQKNDHTDQNWMDGDWSGVKYQVNMDKGWQMLLKIDGKSQRYEVSYPELGCEGTLELISIQGNEALFLEKLEGPCLSEGNIIITKVADKFLSFTCLRDQEQRLASYCTLKKISI